MKKLTTYNDFTLISRQFRKKAFLIHKGNYLNNNSPTISTDYFGEERFCKICGII